MFTDLNKLFFVATAAGLCFSAQVFAEGSNEVAMTKWSKDSSPKDVHSDVQEESLEEEVDYYYDDSDKTFSSYSYIEATEEKATAVEAPAPSVKERKSAAQKARESEEKLVSQ